METIQIEISHQSVQRVTKSFWLDLGINETKVEVTDLFKNFILRRHVLFLEYVQQKLPGIYHPSSACHSNPKSNWYNK